MKFKASAIALAVAGTVAAPMAVQAEGKVYASARIGIHFIENTDTAGEQQVSVASYSSRFGMKGETDLGNGMTGFGKYEFSVGDGATLGSGRHQIVGLKGDFGKLTLGKTYHPYYNHIVGPLDIPWAGSGYAMIDYVGRTTNTIAYDGGSGSVSYGLGLQIGSNTVNDEDIDTIEGGLTFGIGDMNLGVGFRDEAEATVGGDDPDPIISVALSGIGLGSTSWGVSFTSQDDDTSYVIDGTMGGLYIHFEVADFDDASTTSGNIEGITGGVSRAGTSPTAITLGYTQSLGRNTTAWYEIMSVDHDSDVVGVEDQTHIRAVLKYDIL